MQRGTTREILPWNLFLHALNSLIHAYCDFKYFRHILKIIIDIQEKPQSQNIAYPWHQMEVETNHDRQYTTSYRQKKNKTNKKQAKQPDPPPPPTLFSKKGDHNARQGPLNTTIRQLTGQNWKKKKNEKTCLTLSAPNLTTFVVCFYKLSFGKTFIC